MVPESIESKKTKNYSNPTYGNSIDVSSPWKHDRFEDYTSGYEPKGTHNNRYKQKKTYNELSLVVNERSLVLNNYEKMDMKLFALKLSDFLGRLKLDEEIYLITKIKIMNELSKAKSQHFDDKVYDELLVRFLGLTDRHRA